MKQYLEKLTILLEKLKSLFAKLPLHGALFAVAKKILFVCAAILLGLWIALNFTLPPGVILSFVNKPLFEQDMGLTVDSLGYFPLKTFSLEDGTLSKKGVTVLTFSELSYTPSLWGIMSGRGSGGLLLEGVSGEDNYLDASFSLGDFPCYDIVMEEIPLNFLMSLTDNTETLLRGNIDGDIDFCIKEGAQPKKSKKKRRRTRTPSKEMEGDFSFSLHDIVFKGKVPTQMGKLDVGRIPLGNIELAGIIDKKSVKIKKFTIHGLFDIDITGEIHLNSRAFNQSRLNLTVTIEVADQKELKKNTALVTVLSFLKQYQDRKNKQKYHFDLKGTLSSPNMRKARKINTKSSRKKRQKTTRSK